MEGATKELTMPELTAMIHGVIDEKMKGLTKVDRKFGAFDGLNDEQIDKLAWAEKFKLFLKSLTRGEVQTCREFERSWDLQGKRKQMVESTDTAGGYLVPEEFRAEIIRIIPKYGVARRLCRVLPMNSDTMRIPRQTGTVSVTWPGEAAKGTGSKPTLGQVLLNSKTMVGLCSYSAEFLADAGLPILQYLQTIFAEEMAAEEDNQLFNGTGLPFVGILGASGTNTWNLGGATNSGKTTIGSAVVDDVIDAHGMLSEDADDNVWLVGHKNLMTALRKVKVTSDYALAPATQGMPGTVAGMNWTTSKKLPSAPSTSTLFAVVGNFQYAIIGDREQMTIALAREGTIGSDNLFEQNMSGLRITERIAMAVAVPSAFTVLKTAAS